MQKAERDRRRVYAQNFLCDPKVAERIVKEATLSKHDAILEIGPGDGALTHLLAQESERVVAIEKDPIQAEKLTRSLRDSNVHPLQADITTYEYLNHFKKSEDGIGDFIVVSNLPYYAATHILRLLLSAQVRPKRMILMFQKEVAERICAKPGDLTVLGVTAQWFADVEPLFEVPPEAFLPKPRVFSEVIKVTPKSNSQLLAKPGDEAGIFRVVRVGFSSKRKKLLNNLVAGLHISREVVENLLAELNLSQNVRAQELTLKNWLDIAKKVEDSIAR